MQTRATAIAYGDDGLLASAADYGKFVEALFKGNLVSPASLNAMTANWLKIKGVDNSYIADGWYYGLGLMHVKSPYPAIGHGEEFLGTGTMMSYYPESDVTIALATNRGMGLISSEQTTLFRKTLFNEVAKVAIDQ